jgi:sugar/nucleoside kinase (ribokinase family)
MYDICTIGHITKDKVVTGESVKFMPGGTAFYFSKALQQFAINYLLVTAVAADEMYVIAALQKDGIAVHNVPSQHSVFFENIYLGNQDHREQNVLAIADPFSIEAMPRAGATIYHLGPLLADDIPVNMIQLLASKGLVSLDVQGYLRSVHNKKVFYADWKDKVTALPYVSILKANEFEMETITGIHKPHEGAQYLAALGVKEVIITLGSKGSLVLANDKFYTIPAYHPTTVADATGCGDTYMAGYLYKKIKGSGIAEAASYGAAMATLKIQSSGPFKGTSVMVQEVIESSITA